VKAAAPLQRRLLGRTLQALPEAEAAGTKLMAALKASSLAEMRQKTPWEILAIPSSTRFESSVPINDGYVMPGTTDQIFAEHRQNDVPLLLGANSDEGSNFPHMKTLASFRDDALQTLGPFADEFLRVYAANDDAQAAKASAAAVRDMRINWPNLQWAKAQAHTGRSKLFYYYFRHSPPASPQEQYVENLGRDLGSYHGAELAYVFSNFVPHEWAWTQEDRDFARTMSSYWVNFATSGDPNGAGLPEWPVFDPNISSVLYLGKTIERGPIPNQKYYAFWDAFAAAWKGPK
jgi:para-nitrobenzyl esterase